VFQLNTTVVLIVLLIVWNSKHRDWHRSEIVSMEAKLTMHNMIRYNVPCSRGYCWYIIWTHL